MRLATILNNIMPSLPVALTAMQPAAVQSVPSLAAGLAGKAHIEHLRHPQTALQMQATCPPAARKHFPSPDLLQSAGPQTDGALPGNISWLTVMYSSSVGNSIQQSAKKRDSQKVGCTGPMRQARPPCLTTL